MPNYEHEVERLPSSWMILPPSRHSPRSGHTRGHTQPGMLRTHVLCPNLTAVFSFTWRTAKESVFSHIRSRLSVERQANMQNTELPLPVFLLREAKTIKSPEFPTLQSSGS